jgi:hypothetical protein
MCPFYETSAKNSVNIDQVTIFWKNKFSFFINKYFFCLDIYGFNKTNWSSNAMCQKSITTRRYAFTDYFTY